MVDLPELTMPMASDDVPVTGAASGNAGLPPFLVEDHAIELTPAYANSAMRAGHALRRRLYTTTPRIVTASLRLSQAQMTVFHDWFEGPLKAGAERFSARVAHQGPGLRWWRALYVAPPVEDALPGGYWKVTQRLLLTGEGSAVAPPSTSLRAAITCALDGSAALTVGKPLAAAIVVALESGVSLRASIVVELLDSNQGAGYELREDGGRALREDSGYALRD